MSYKVNKAVALVKSGEYSFESAAKAFGIPVSTVKLACQRAGVSSAFGIGRPGHNDLSALDELARSDYENARKQSFSTDEAYRIALDDMNRRKAKLAGFVSIGDAARKVVHRG